MSSFTDSEKVQYALKYALNVTMQHKSLSAYAEERAPKRIFPSNIMSKDIISKGEGDLDADGNYLQGHVFNPAGTLTVAANISTPVTTVQYYKIVDPSINIVSNVTVNDILSNPDITGMSYDSIAALGDSSVDSNDPWYNKAVKIQQLQKAWFFRGHYGGAASEGDMFSHATTNYKGLYLAYNKIAAGTVVDVTDATKVVPHIKLYLQVQTENIATGSDGTGDVDNMSFRHSLLENMLGLESGFANVVPVQGPHYTSASSEKMPIIQTGIMGNEWYSQDTYGMLSFYALGSGSHTVADNYPDPSTPHGTSSPLVSYLRYIGETAATTGLGGGSGGGSGGSSGGGGTVSTVGLGGTFMGDQLVPVDASGLEIMLNATTGTSIGDGEFNVYTDIDLRGGSTLLLNGTPAIFSNWGISGENIYRESKVGIGMNDPEYAMDVSGDIRLSGALKDDAGNDRIFSNWGISGENIYRLSKVGVGTNNPLHALDISGDLNIVGNVTVNSINATESFDYIAPINQLQEADEEPSWTGNVSTSIGFDELVDGNIPESLDTLKEIAELVKDISNSNALTVGLGLKANKASPVFTGNVGIGQVANVNYALDIIGDLNITSGSIRGAYDSDTNSYFGRAFIGKITGLSDYTGFGHLDCTANTDYAVMQSANGETYINAKSDQTIRFRIANSDQMRINSNGNVGIGTSPSYKLHVAGDINLTGTLYQNGTAFGAGGLEGRGLYYNTGSDTGNGCIVIGLNAGINFTATTYHNIGIGYNALYYNSGTYNIAMGYEALKGTSDHTGCSQNVAIGYYALKSRTSANNNVAVGRQCGEDITTGSMNVLIGYQTGGNMTNSGENVFLGSVAGNKLTSGGYHNVGLGYGACGGIGATATNIQNNVCIGQSSGGKLTTGYDNVYLGCYSGLQCTAGSLNIAIGKEAGRYKTDKSGYIAIGREALYSNMGGSQSIAIGYQALKSSAGNNHYDNTAIGYQSMRVVTTGVGNTCLGYQAGYSISSGWYNVLIGKNAGDSITTQYRNVCLGQNAGQAATSHDSVYIGADAGCHCTGMNIGIGYQSMYHNSSTYNIAIGYQALRGGENHTGRAQNVCIGYQTLNPATSATANVAIGHQAGMRMTSGNYNTLIGHLAGQYVANNHYNICVGYSSGQYIYYGQSNICIGMHTANAYSGAVQNMSNCIILGSYAGPKTNETGNTCKLIIGAPAAQNGDSYRGAAGSFIYGDFNNTTLSNRWLRINAYLGISTTPSFPLHVEGSSTANGGSVGYMNSSGIHTTSSASSDSVSIKSQYVIWCTSYIMANSDHRIKENIVDVPDNLALEMVRNIPCRYYEYKDKQKRGFNKTIGFIAQEVKEHFPMAVSIQKEFIPNEMQELEIISWEEIIDGSNNTYKLTTDLQDVSGVKYRFYVSNDPSDNEIKKEIMGNSDNTFTFEEKWNNVFCYGKEVDDFHTLTKEKLFALNFSATQELDKKVIALEEENQTIKQELDKKVIALEEENQTIKQENEDLKFQMALLRSELMTIKAHLGI